MTMNDTSNTIPYQAPLCVNILTEAQYASVRDNPELSDSLFLTIDESQTIEEAGGDTGQVPYYTQNQNIQPGPILYSKRYICETLDDIAVMKSAAISDDSQPSP